MKHWLQYGLLLKIKYIAKCFYRFNLYSGGLNLQGKNSLAAQEWQQLKLIIFLNHTSLFEPLLLGVAPNNLIKHIAEKLVVPAADSTLKRPFVGKLLSTFIPGCIPISRKKDHTWQYFLEQIDDDKLTAVLPEGRMKRRNGLDKDGKPMTIKAGVVDILKRLHSGKILFVYSGGLHHIQAPGDKFPRLFKAIDVGLELLDVQQYKSLYDPDKHKTFTSFVLDDLQHKLNQCQHLTSGTFQQ